MIRDSRNRVFLHRRSPHRRVLPGAWDVVGGHVEAGETAEQALGREIAEETGWRLLRIEAAIADWRWQHDGVARRERDYLVEVDGDLSSPLLEDGKHDAYAWMGPQDLDVLAEGRADDDRGLSNVVAKATRIRLTERLRLEPIGPEHADHLHRLHADSAVAEWYGGPWSPESAAQNAADFAAAWESDGVSKWIAFERHTDELVGRGGLSYAVVDGRRRLEVGWALLADRWGQGYASEIGRAALAFAWADLAAEEVVSFTETHNARSRAVMERLGMGHARDILHNGEPFALYVATPS